MSRINLKRPYWWHGYPWLLCNLLAFWMISATLDNLRDHDWIWAAISAFAIYGSYSWAGDHQRKYDAIKAKENLNTFFKNIFEAGKK